MLVFPVNSKGNCGFDLFHETGDGMFLQNSFSALILANALILYNVAQRFAPGAELKGLRLQLHKSDPA